ncbi:hypothetical protein QZM97_02620 [Burkholderia orbicola]|nr:hypothetical protein [Burkholderia orbicola]MDN7988963.1 hypothetical protein [Burkholderia orbicola]
MQTFVKIALFALGSLFVVGIIYEVIDRIRGAMKNIENDEHHRH